MNDQTLSHPARIRQIQARDSDPLMAILEDKLGITTDRNLIYFWRAEISNNQLDTHFTRMTESTLKNYATDASTGVAFLRGHDWASLPLGYSLTGKVEVVDGRKRVVADFYTMTGLADTDDVVKRMKGGLLRDVSVGFSGGEMKCDLCGEDYWQCPHLPGFRYDGKVATFEVQGARLNEVSGVFDGSTPNAMILKARQIADAGRLTVDEAHWLEQTHRVKLNASVSARTFVTDFETPQGDTMEQKDLQRIERVIARFEDVTFDVADIPAAFEAMGEQFDAATARATELAAEAADGRKYRNDLIAEALGEGVRAYGNDFDKAAYEPMLKAAPLDTIKRMKTDWQRVADAALPGGRHSQDTADDDAPTAPVSKYPARAFAS